MSERILDRYAKVLERIAVAQKKAGASEILLVAVSKFHVCGDIAKLAGAGQKNFGENYVQEALAKMNDLEDLSLRWHMIGHVQTRKARTIAGKFALIHTLDSQKLADALETGAVGIGSSQDVLIEINIAAEPQKSGIAAAQTPVLVEHVMKNCPHLNLQGFMCLPPVLDAGDAAAPWFAKLRKLRDSLARDFGMPFPQLSMGMSGDFETAIAEGATIVRIGADIFGPRPVRT